MHIIHIRHEEHNSAVPYSAGKIAINILVQTALFSMQVHLICAIGPYIELMVIAGRLVGFPIENMQFLTLCIMHLKNV